MTKIMKVNIIKVDDVQNPPLVVARVIGGEVELPNVVGSIIYFRPKDHCCFLWSTELERDAHHRQIVKHDPTLEPNHEVEVEYEYFEKNFAHKIHCLTVTRDNVPTQNEPVIRVSDLLRYAVFTDGEKRKLYEFVPPADYIKAVGADKLAIEIIKQVPTELLIKELLERGYFKN